MTHYLGYAIINSVNIIKIKMTLLNNLKMQEIDESFDNSLDDRLGDDICLVEPVDESELDNFWEKVVKDIHQDSD